MKTKEEKIDFYLDEFIDTIRNEELEPIVSLKEKFDLMKVHFNCELLTTLDQLEKPFSFVVDPDEKVFSSKDEVLIYFSELDEELLDNYKNGIEKVEDSELIIVY